MFLTPTRSNQWLDHSTNAISRPQDSRHKLSDSRSSFSSYTSSSFSTCHSRFSSMSTVSGVHSAGSAITEMPPTDTKFSHFQDTITVPTLVNVQPPSPRTLPSPVEDSSRPCLGLQPRSSAYAISKTMTIPENSRYVPIFSITSSYVAYSSNTQGRLDAEKLTDYLQQCFAIINIYTHTRLAG